MDLTSSRQIDGEGFAPLIEVDMQADDFVADWGHCDHLSSYVAKMVSHNRTDSILYANLFSSALNELLETVFRKHAGGGRFCCRIWRSGPTDRVELIIPCEAEHRDFYLRTVELAHEPGAEEQYRAMLFSDHDFDIRTGLLELAVDYGAAITVDVESDTAIRLTADLMLEARKN